MLSENRNRENTIRNDEPVFHSDRIQFLFHGCQRSLSIILAFYFGWTAFASIGYTTCNRLSNFWWNIFLLDMQRCNDPKKNKFLSQFHLGAPPRVLIWAQCNFNFNWQQTLRQTEPTFLIFVCKPRVHAMHCTACACRISSMKLTADSVCSVAVRA
jgi:hypothetical protein